MREREAYILKRLHEGEIVALISDTGTPGISDLVQNWYSLHLLVSYLNFFKVAQCQAGHCLIIGEGVCK
jgi:hypothetical protein